MPRDRQSEFEPAIVKKNQRDISSIEDQVLSMYARGMSQRDMEKHLESIYGIDASPDLITRITDKIIPLVTEWQNRPLDSIFAIVFTGAIHYKVRQYGKSTTKAAYTAIGVNLDGVKDILIASVDGLLGFNDAIKAVFPHTEIQRCN
ncbi:MAG: Transposase, Mutator family [Actinobacteria bacterium ADurb.Bin346]|nr:MAG: Transposase, Mutator family [Actinobacteria bacterium ADurb.Bin346]